MPLTRKQKLICWLAFGLVGLLKLSYRFRYINEFNRQAVRAKNGQGQILYACWHQNALSTVLAHAWRQLTILVSRSFDGEVIAFVCKHFGIQSARGSSSRGGREALREMIKLARDGYELGITVDGPRGPRYEVKHGIIMLASRTGIPILPTASLGRRTYTLYKSWDHFRVPKPFTEVLVLYGTPMVVESEISDQRIAQLQQELAAALLDLDQQLANMVSLKVSSTHPIA